MPNIELLNLRNVVKGKMFNITPKEVDSLLKKLEINDVELVCNNDKDGQDQDIYLEEVVRIDKYRALQGDTVKYYVVQNPSGKDVLMCFEPHFDRVMTRTSQQQISDTTTSVIIQNLTDKLFQDIFVAFYAPLQEILKQYAVLNNISYPSKLCLFYKGGNMFRMLLEDMAGLFKDPKFKDMLKRSDADFQIFIDPDLPDINKIRSDVSKLVLYVLYSLKETLRKGKTFALSSVISSLLDTLEDEYIKQIKLIDDISHVNIGKVIAVRSDFQVGMVNHQEKDYISVQKQKTILKNIDSTNSVYYISRNTTLDFARKDNRRATFDLLRLKRNIKLFIVYKDGHEVHLSVPFEVIDVSIPRDNDYGLHKIKGHIQDYVRSYNLGNRLTFMAPTIEYLYMDLHDVLFKQNDYPWQDIKYNKRITRYFLSVIVYHLVSNDKVKTKKSLQELLHTFKYFQSYIKCISKANNKPCAFDKTQVKVKPMQIFFQEYESLQKRVINNAQDVENLRQFGKNIIPIFKDLSLCIKDLLKTFTQLDAKAIHKIFNRLTQTGNTNIL